MEEIQIVSRNYVSRMLREDKAILLEWTTDGTSYMVKIKLVLSNKIVRSFYKEFPTYLARKYEKKYPNFITGDVKN
jgi:hypothetical protein